VNKVRKLGEVRARYAQEPRYLASRGESGSLANKPCIPVGRADWGRGNLLGTILAVSLLHQFDKPTGGKTVSLRNNINL
jgi:hypothetical protein